MISASAAFVTNAKIVGDLCSRASRSSGHPPERPLTDVALKRAKCLVECRKGASESPIATLRAGDCGLAREPISGVAICEIYNRRRILAFVERLTPEIERGRGRPSIGVRVPVRLPPAVLDEIDRRARVLGRPRASVIRSLLLEALGQTDTPDDGVDRAQIRRMLAMSPADRIRHMTEVASQQSRLRAKARRPAR